MELTSVKRKPNGSLLRMRPRQQQAAVRLIRAICSNYDNGNCLLTDSVCTQEILRNVHCKTFRQVLLEDKDGLKLKSELIRDDTVKHCKNCGKPYRSKSNNAKYCTDCAKETQRKQKAEYARKRRWECRKVDVVEASSRNAYKCAN